MTVPMENAAYETILRSVQQHLGHMAQVDPAQLQSDSPLKDLGMDSLAVIEFMLSMENEFKIRVPDGRMQVKTVGDVAATIEGLLRERKAA